MYTDTDFLQVHSITLYRELKSKITDMKNSLEGLSNRSEQAEERIHELKDKSINIVYTEEEKDKERERNEQSLRDLWNTIKHSSVFKMWVSEAKKKHQKEYLNNKNSPIWLKKKNGLPTQKASWTSSRINCIKKKKKRKKLGIS